MQTTIMSTLYLCYAAIPHMLERGSGSIVATQSYSVKHPVARLITSNSLRMAVIGLMKSLANELGPHGIRVNTINPTYTWTNRVDQLVNDAARPTRLRWKKKSGSVLRQFHWEGWGNWTSTGKTIAWLASPAASFIHGHALMFDGGGVSARSEHFRPRPRTLVGTPHLCQFACGWRIIGK